MKRYLLLLAFALCQCYAHAQHVNVDSVRGDETSVDTAITSSNIPEADELWRKANKLYEQKKYQAALDIIDRAIILAPDYADIIDFRYYALVKLGRYEEALVTLERAYMLDPSMKQYLENKGNMLHELKMYDSALLYYQQAIEFNPYDERYYYNYIYALSEKRRFKKLKKIGTSYEALYDKGAINENLNDSRADIFFYIALANQYTNDTTRAIDYYTRAIAITPYSGYLSNRGLLYEDQKNYTLAIADYNKMISLKPKEPDAYYNRARVYAAMDLDEKALADLLKAKNLGKDDADLNNNLGNAYRNLRKNKLAMQSFQRVLTLDPENEIVRTNLAILYKQMGNDSLSQEEYGRATTKATAKEIPFYNQAYDLQKNKQLQKAIPYYDSAIHYKPDFIEAYNQLGLCYIELDKDSMGVVVFSKAIKINPGYDLVYVNRAAAYKALKNYKAAEDDYKKAYELNPKNTIIFYTLAKLYHDIGDDNKASSYFTNAERLGVDHVSFYIDYSSFLSQRHQLKKCIQLATAGIKKYPGSAALYNNRGSAYHDLDSMSLAIKDYETAIRVDPKDASACYNLGNAYLKIGNNRQAADQYKRAIDIDGTVYPYYLNLANAYENMKDHDNAFAALTTAIRLNADCSDAYFNRGAIYSDLHQMDKAIKDYDMAIDLLERYGPCDHEVKGEVIEESKSNILLKKAVIYQSTLRYDKAIQSYEAYLNFNTTDAEAYDNYGYCLLEADKITEARKALDRAYELDKKNPDIIAGLIAVHYLLDNKAMINTYKQALWKLKPKLPKTAASLEMLEQEGYNYTVKFKKIYGDCF